LEATSFFCSPLFAESFKKIISYIYLDMHKFYINLRTTSKSQLNALVEKSAWFYIKRQLKRLIVNLSRILSRSEKSQSTAARMRRRCDLFSGVARTRREKSPRGAKIQEYMLERTEIADSAKEIEEQKNGGRENVNEREERKGKE
jgi:hypothetical protein